MEAPAHPAVAAVRAFALSLPEAWEDHPWGERAMKVGKKVFVFLGKGDDPEQGFSVTVKLPVSAARVLERPDAAPTGYGLGRSGWVTVRIEPGGTVPLDKVRTWVAESYRAVATKKLVKLLDAGAAVPGIAAPPGAKATGA